MDGPLYWLMVFGRRFFGVETFISMAQDNLQKSGQTFKKKNQISNF